jgi:single-strand DNA-binding protein
LASVNKIILVGRLTTDPDVKITSNGYSVTNFTIAVKRPYFAENSSAKIDYIDIVAWRDLADKIKESCEKDSLVLIDGRINTRTWDDDSGKRFWATEVDAKDFCLLDQKSATPSPLVEKPEGFSSLEEKKSPELKNDDFDFGEKQAQDITAAEDTAKEGEEEIPF